MRLPRQGVGAYSAIGQAGDLPSGIPLSKPSCGANTRRSRTSLAARRFRLRRRSPSGIQNYVAGTGYNQATGHQVEVILACADTSGSGTVQVCNTSPAFTPVAGDCIIYTTTTANTGTGLTLNVNSRWAQKAWQSGRLRRPLRPTMCSRISKFQPATTERIGKS